MAFPLPWLHGIRRPLELRIDVRRPEHAPNHDLAELQRRLRRPGAPRLRPLPVDAGHPGLVFLHREADGEHYVYVEDTARGRLVGCTVFNRLVEVGRRADRHLRSPHSRYDADWQRRGLASAAYRWALDSGFCLVSGARQSPGAHALWQALARRHPLAYVELTGRTLRHLGSEVAPEVRDALSVRLLLMGRGWDAQRLATLASAR